MWRSSKFSVKKIRFSPSHSAIVFSVHVFVNETAASMFGEGGMNRYKYNGDTDDNADLMLEEEYIGQVGHMMTVDWAGFDLGVVTVKPGNEPHCGVQACCWPGISLTWYGVARYCSEVSVGVFKGWECLHACDFESLTFNQDLMQIGHCQIYRRK